MNFIYKHFFQASFSFMLYITIGHVAPNDGTDRECSKTKSVFIVDFIVV